MRAGKSVQQRRLAGVRVADDRSRLQLRAPPAGALLVALPPHLLDLAVQVTDAFADAPPLGLDLLLARTAAGADTATQASDLAVVRVGTDEAREQVMQARGFDLQAALVGPRVQGKDFEDHFSAIEHPAFQRSFEVSLLPRAQVLVANEHVESALAHHFAQRVDL